MCAGDILAPEEAVAAKQLQNQLKVQSCWLEGGQGQGGRGSSMTEHRPVQLYCAQGWDKPQPVQLFKLGWLAILQMAMLCRQERSCGL